MTDKLEPVRPPSLANQFLEAAKKPRKQEGPISLWRWCEGCGLHRWHVSEMHDDCERLTCECGWETTVRVR